jgi:hypothetical protein
MLMDFLFRTRKIRQLTSFNAVAKTAADTIPVNVGVLTSTSVGVIHLGEGANMLAIFPNGFSGASKSISIDVIGVPGDEGVGVRLKSLTFNSEVTNWKTSASSYASAVQSVDLLGYQYIYIIVTSITAGESIFFYGFGY